MATQNFDNFDKSEIYRCARIGNEGMDSQRAVPSVPYGIGAEENGRPSTSESQDPFNSLDISECRWEATSWALYLSNRCASSVIQHLGSAQVC